MAADWTYPLDMCAASGIIDYDAAADILNQKPRFVGNPKISDLPKMSPLYLPEDTKIQTSPDKDTFGNPVKDDGNFIQNPMWKKVLTGVLVTGGIGAGIAALLLGKGKIKLPDLSKIAGKIKLLKIDFSKIKSKIKMPKFSKPKLKMPDFSKIGTTLKNAAETVWKYIKKPFSYFANIVKKRP